MSKISDLFQLAIEKETGYEEINFGYIPNYQAQSINQQTGLKVNGSLKILSTFAITHILKEHGCGCKQEERGQKSVTEKDFEFIPSILSDYDEISFGGQNSKLKSCLLFKKKINNVTYHLIACYSEAKDSNNKMDNKLFVNTMYIKK